MPRMGWDVRFVLGTVILKMTCWVPVHNAPHLATSAQNQAQTQSNPKHRPGTDPNSPNQAKQAQNLKLLFGFCVEQAGTPPTKKRFFRIRPTVFWINPAVFRPFRAVLQERPPPDNIFFRAAQVFAGLGRGLAPALVTQKKPTNSTKTGGRTCDLSAITYTTCTIFWCKGRENGRFGMCI